MKTCNRCKKEKEVSEFRNENKNCNKCNDYIALCNKKSRSDTEKYERIKSQIKAYNERNKDKLRKWQKTYKEKNEKKHKSNQKKYQKAIYSKVKSRRISTDTILGTVENIAKTNLIGASIIAQEIGIWQFPSKSYYIDLAVYFYSVFKYGGEQDKEVFRKKIEI